MRIVIFILVLGLLNSCKNSIPSGIIKPEKMQGILWDLVRADALSQEIVKKDSTKKQPDEKIALTKKVFLIHGITKEEYEKSYSFYVQRPDMIKSMLDSIDARQMRLNSIALERSARLDSLKTKAANDSIKKIETDSLNKKNITDSLYKKKVKDSVNNKIIKKNRNKKLVIDTVNKKGR